MAGQLQSEVRAPVPPPPPSPHLLRQGDVEASVDVYPGALVQRRLPPPHLGSAYCSVFVETAALEVVTEPVTTPGRVMPGRSGSGLMATEDERLTSAAARREAARVAEARVPRPRAEGTVVDASPLVASTTELPAAPTIDSVERGAGEAVPLLVSISGRALTVVVVAGLGVLAVIALELLVLGGTLLLSGGLTSPG